MGTIGADELKRLSKDNRGGVYSLPPGFTTHAGDRAMTAKQWRLLKVLEHNDGVGTMEVLMQMEYEPKSNSEADIAKAWNLTKFVIAGMVATLVRKGLATDDTNGWGITERGRELLAKRAARLGAAS